ncbi:MAG TPA: FtsX-like permease family protein [Candidatus Limnocylindria bacterium]|nr:FtsX-like permease family protein [Candidatus Limnocylindria bacterium]
MRALLRLSARHFARARARAALTVFGVALGVATLVAIDVVNGSSSSTIDELVSAYAGRADITVRAAAGTLAPDALDAVRRVDGVRSAAGSIQGALLVGGTERAALPFIAGTGDEDAVREHVFETGRAPLRSGEVALGREASRRLGLRVGAALLALTPSGTRTLTVSGVLADAGVGRANGGFLAVLDFATADALYARAGRLDAVDVVTAPGAPAAAVMERIERAVPGAIAGTPESRGGQTKRLVASLQSLLQVVSALSLFVGTFLVFNTMSIAVAQRKREFGVLRALGARRRELVAVVAAEAAVLGLAASVAGGVLGLTLAQALLGAVNRQIRLNFIAGLADQLVVPWDRFAALVAFGVIAAVAGALGPALAAASAPPAEAMTTPRHTAVARPLRLRLLLVAGGFVILAGIAVAAQRGAADTGPGSAAALALMLAIAMAAAPLLALGVRLVGPLLDRALGLPARLARDSVLRAPGRAAVTAAALAAAVTMVVGMASFIESDRRTIFGWLDQAVNADLFVSAAPLGGSSAPVSLAPALGTEIERIPGVRLVDRFRQTRVDYEGSLVAVSSTDVNVYLSRARPLFAPGTEPYDLAKIIGRDEAFVSDNFARKHDVRQGGEIGLPTPAGPVRFRVVAVIVDYTTDQGLVFMDRGTYVRHFRDESVDSFAVMLEDRSREAEVRRALEALQGGVLFIQSNAEFKASIRAIVDDFFATTYVMEAIALVVGVLGVANTMIVAVLERRREIGVLRAVGALRRQVRRTILIEAGMIGAAGALLGLAGGAALAGITMVITESTTGWVLPYLYEWGTAASVTLLATAAAIAAAWWPARSAARLAVAEALAYE